MTDGHFDTKKASLLDEEARLSELRPLQLLKTIGGISKGMTCVDLACGTGTFSFPMAECVGEAGLVHAVDDSADMLAHLHARNPTPNIRTVHRDAGSTGLEGQIADFCLLAFILHEVDEPKRIVVEASRLTKPQGRALVVEWKPKLDSPGPPPHRRLATDHVDQLFATSGFPHRQYVDWSTNYYVVLGSKAPLGQPLPASAR